MAARDHLADFWIRVQHECNSKGIIVGSPERGTELSIRATTGVSWTLHHRANHIRPGIILRPSTNSSPSQLVRQLQPALREIEARVGRVVTVEQKNTISRKARIYLKVDSFDGEDFSTWDRAIAQAVDEWCIIMAECQKYL